ncbi:MAG: ABC transporter, partial [Gammaproteobacteria bacterium]|nr:ABC transporter [Gammaproteobacteria bacterium]
MKTRLRQFGIACVSGAAIMLSATSNAEVESSDPIILTLHDWTGQYITTTIMGRVLQEMGYNIEYQQADYL